MGSADRNPRDEAEAAPVDAIVLAAGYGTRLRPLTDDLPKPLLEVGGRALIDYHLDALCAAGVRRIAINCAYRGELIAAHVARRPGTAATLTVVREGAEPLETGGGILNALSHLTTPQFLVVNADVFSVFPLARLARFRLQASDLAHLVLVPNPPHHPRGDFSVSRAPARAGTPAPARAGVAGTDRATYAGIALLDRSLFAERTPGRFPLGPLLHAAAAAGQVSAEVFEDTWVDVGTPDRLALADRLARKFR